MGMTDTELVTDIETIREALATAVDGEDPENDMSPGQLYIDARDALERLTTSLTESKKERDKAVRDYMHGTQHWVDATCHYRNLAITLGAKPDTMLDQFDRELAEKGVANDYEGWDKELPSVWDDLEKAEQERDELREAALNALESLRLAHVYALKDSQPEELLRVIPDFKKYKWDGYEIEYAEKASAAYRTLLNALTATQTEKPENCIAPGCIVNGECKATLSGRLCKGVQP